MSASDLAQEVFGREGMGDSGRAGCGVGLRALLKLSDSSEAAVWAAG